MTNPDLEAMKPSFAEQTRLDDIEYLYDLMGILTSIRSDIHKKVFIRKAHRKEWLKVNEAEISALALAINVLGKVRFKDDVYPFEIEGMVTTFREEGKPDLWTYFTPVKEELK